MKEERERSGVTGTEMEGDRGREIEGVRKEEKDKCPRWQ